MKGGWENAGYVYRVNVHFLVGRFEMLISRLTPQYYNCFLLSCVFALCRSGLDQFVQINFFNYITYSGKAKTHELGRSIMPWLNYSFGLFGGFSVHELSPGHCDSSLQWNDHKLWTDREVNVGATWLLTLENVCLFFLDFSSPARLCDGRIP